MSSFQIKLIAIVAMLIDHIGAILIPRSNQYYVLFRGIGRLAFPLFVFLLIEGFCHTKNTKKYLLRMCIFALVSEIPFNLAFYNRVFYPGHQNIFFTLALGLGMLIIIQKIETLKFDIYALSILQGATLLGFCGLAFFLCTDYQHLGIILIMIYYLFRGKNYFISLAVLALYVYMYLGSITNYSSMFYIGLATISTCFLFFYNGTRGKDIKYLFYIFYPAHLLILFLIRMFL